MFSHKLLPVLLLILISGCATHPIFDDAVYQQQPTSETAVSDIDTFKNQNVLWGGILISIAHLENRTQLEVLNYPLFDNQKPDPDQPPYGRFIVLIDDYLEPTDFSEGGLVTIAGKISGTQKAKVGSSEQVYVIVEGDQIHLWPKKSRYTNPGFNFGFGIIFSN